MTGAEQQRMDHDARACKRWGPEGSIKLFVEVAPFD
jgi:hypothetical protein